MASNQSMRQCRQCGKMTLHVGPSTSHVLHLLMSVITFGVWIIVWVLVSASNASQWQCTTCGKVKGVFGT